MAITIKNIDDSIAFQGRLQILVQVSDGCPLDCIYCYKGTKSGRVMEKDIVAKIIRLAANRPAAEKTEFIWLGAEPLTAGLSFYRNVVRLQKKYLGHSYENKIQSNGVLLTASIADFLIDNSFKINFSLDGPDYLHDKTRPFRNGKPSFRHTMRAFEMMWRRGIKPAALAVATRSTLSHLEEIYHFFKSHGIPFKVNLAEPTEDARLCRSVMVPNQTERYRILSGLFDMWHEDGHEIEVRPVSGIYESFFTGIPSSCEFSRNCQESIISISSDGYIIPCSRFSPERMNYGHIRDIDSFTEIELRSDRSAFFNRLHRLSTCKRCRYFRICHCGCPHSAFVNSNRITSRTPDCRAFKLLFRHIEKVIYEEM